MFNDEGCGIHLDMTLYKLAHSSYTETQVTIGSRKLTVPFITNIPRLGERCQSVQSELIYQVLTGILPTKVI